MPDALQTALAVARRWRQAKGDEAAGGLVLTLDGYFVGWVAELPPAAQWVPGCLAIASDGHAYLIDQPSFREPLQWFDLDTPEALAGPPPSPHESPDEPKTTPEP